MLIALIFWWWGLVKDLPAWLAVLVILGVIGSVLWIWNQITFRRYLSIVGPSVDATLPDAWDARQLASTAELAGPKIVKRAVKIFDVPRNGEAIEGRIFEDCTIIGPAIVAFSEGTSLQLPVFSDPGQIKWLFWVIAQDRKALGVIGLKRCLFLRCRFNGIGFCGTRKQVKEWQEQITDGR